MKKAFYLIVFIFTISIDVFAEWKQIATTYNTSLSYMDIMEIFIEEINKPHYAHILWHYDVFTKENEQNYAWAVYINTDGYSGKNGKVKERSVYLHTNNGKIYFNTFSESTEWTIMGIREISENHDFSISLQRDRIWATFLDESNRWLNRYGRQYSVEQLNIFDVFFKNYCKTTEVIVSAQENKIDYLKFLLQNGFDVNEKSKKDGATPLMKAAYSGHIEIVKFLLQNQAKIDERNDEGQTALFYACDMGNKEIVQILLQSLADINIKNRFGSTALIKAINYHSTSLEIVKMLIQAGADVNASGNYALYSACLYSSEEMIYTLLQAGAKINNASSKNIILADCIEEKRDKAIRILINKKTEISILENDIQTQLIIAAYNNDVQSTKRLINQGADINKTNIDGLTPLMLACANNSKDVFNYLLENGASVSIESPLDYGLYGNNTALDVAVIYGNKDFVSRMLESNNLEIEIIRHAFQKATERDEIEIVNLLVEADKNDIYKDIVYRNVAIIDSLKPFYYFMTNDINALEYELKRYGCRLPVWNELEDDDRLSYDVRKTMIDLDCCWAITVSDILKVLYYFPFGQGVGPKKVCLYKLEI